MDNFRDLEMDTRTVVNHKNYRIIRISYLNFYLFKPNNKTYTSSLGTNMQVDPIEVCFWHFYLFIFKSILIFCNILPNDLTFP